ncbi:MAG: glycosyltransferase [Acidobacteriota bacterium]
MITLHIDTARSWRGGQSQVLHTVLGLREQGHRAALVAHPQGELARRAAEGTDVYRLAPAHEVDFGAAFRLARVLKDVQPAVVHAHDPHAVSFAAMALSLMGRAPRPALVAARRVDFHLKRNAFSRWKYSLVDAMIASSEAIRGIVITDGFPAERVITVHEGIDVDRVAAQPPIDLHKELWLPGGSPIVGNVAALVPHKGQRYLIDAAALVFRERPDVQFLVFGEGELRKPLQYQIRHLGLERHVQLVGFRTDVLSCVRGFDVFVLSSVTEGLGTSLLDAMALARPVVATTAGGIPEVAEDGVTGLLVPPQHGGPLAEAILALLADPPRRRQMGEAGLARVRARFTARRMVEETMIVYERVAGRPHASDTASPPPSS